MKWSVTEFCGALAWTLTLHCVWFNVFLPLREERSDDICFLTCREIKQLRYPVEANDGFIYDAMNLQHWLTTCKKDNRELCVIPEKTITRVTPIRVSRVFPQFKFVSVVLRRISRRKPIGIADASTQTESLSTTIRPDPVRSLCNCNARMKQRESNFATTFAWLPHKIRCV